MMNYLTWKSLSLVSLLLGAKPRRPSAAAPTPLSTVSLPTKRVSEGLCDRDEGGNGALPSRARARSDNHGGGGWLGGFGMQIQLSPNKIYKVRVEPWTDV
jgi:hypothetical protein